MQYLTTHPSRLFLLGFVLLVLSVAVPVAAQEEVTDDEVNEVARDLYCPTCANTPLDVCPTQNCEDWRQLIREQLAEGWSEEEIHQYFADRHGAQVLAEPPRDGFTLLIWVLPILAILLGAIFFGRYLLGMRKGPDQPDDDADDTFNVVQSSAQVPPPAADEDEYTSRIEKEVRE